MQQAPTILVISLGLSALLSIYMASHVRLHARTPAAREAAFLLFGVALYTLGAAIEVSRFDLDGILMAVSLEYIGIAFLPALLMLFTLHYIHGESASKLVTFFLLLIPSITVVVVFTQKYHNLYYANPYVDHSGLYPVIVFERGIWYYIHSVFEQFCAFSAIGLLVVKTFRSEKRLKKQTILMVIGSLIPVLSTLLYYFGLIPYNIDPAPFAFTVTGVIYAIIIFRTDLFELVPAARELALDAISEAFVVVDEEGILQDINEAALNLPGAEKIKIGDCLVDNKLLGKFLLPLLQDKQESVEFSPINSNTEKRHYHAKAYKIYKKQGYLDGIAILITDVTQTTRLLKKLSYQANVDGLTGILNRRELMQQAANEIETSHRSGLSLGIILIDLDFFKHINDKYGHVAGDEVLKQVTACFRKRLRGIDILGRYGGEEFVILLPGADIDNSLRVAERLREDMAGCNLVVKAEKITLTASFGVHAMQAKKNTTITELLAIADRALYQAKANGRNQVARSS